MPFPQLPPHCLPPMSETVSASKLEHRFLKHFPPLLLTGICFLKLAHFCTSLSKFPVFDRPIPHFLLPVCFRLWASFGRRAWEFPPQLTSIKRGLLYSYHFLWLIARHLRDDDVVWCGVCQTFRPWNEHWSLTTRHVLKVFSSGVCFRLPVVRIPTAGRLSGSCFGKDALCGGCGWMKCGCKILYLKNLN